MNVYDFDHTVYNGDSSVDFFLYALFRKPYLAILLPYQLWGIVKYLIGAASKESMKEHFFVFLRFIPAREMAVRFWNRQRGKIQSWYLRQQLDSDVVISASPEFLLEPVVRGFLGAALIASKIDPVTGKFCGKNCYGEEKVKRFNALYSGAVIDEFYSDSYADTPLALMSKNAFLVEKNNIVKWGNT